MGLLRFAIGVLLGVATVSPSVCYAADAPRLAGSLGLAQASAGDLHVTAKPEGDRIVILIDLPESAQVEWSSDGRELLLRFPGEIRAPSSTSPFSRPGPASAT